MNLTIMPSINRNRAIQRRSKTQNNKSFGIEIRLNPTFNEQICDVRNGDEFRKVLAFFKDLKMKYPNYTQKFTFHRDVVQDEGHAMAEHDGTAKSVIKATKKLIADKMANASLQKYAEQLSKKYGVKIAFAPEHSMDSTFRGIKYLPAREYAKAMKKAAEIMSEVPDKDKYALEFWSQCDSECSADRYVSISKRNKNNHLKCLANCINIENPYMAYNLKSTVGTPKFKAEVKAFDIAEKQKERANEKLYNKKFEEYRKEAIAIGLNSLDFERFSGMKYFI